jgi:hypothetical protein
MNANFRDLGGLYLKILIMALVQDLKILIMALVQGARSFF